METSARFKVLVIGAGVSGLTTAVCLAESGVPVRVLAKDPPLRTTSAVAGASWGPYLVDDPRVLAWSDRSRSVLESIATTFPTSGVRLVQGLDALPYPGEAPDWATTVTGFRVCQPNELPLGYVSGWSYTIPLVDMPVYLRYLQDRLLSAGGTIEIGTVTAFDEVLGQADAIVNCTGLGARELVPDPELRPTRGQVVVVENPGINGFFQDQSEEDGPDLIYFLPHGDHVVLGGSATKHSDDQRYDPDIAADIVARCALIEPALAGAKVVEHRVGLRPSRFQVRLEMVDIGGTPVIHNYGHGGSGLTLSWGCAHEVLGFVKARSTPSIPAAP